MAQTSRSEFSVQGMNCMGCVRHVEDAIREVPGVATATVELEAAKAVVTWAPGSVPDPDGVTAAVDGAGYTASPLAAASGSSTPAARTALGGWGFNLVFGGTLTSLLLAGEWILGLGHERWFQWVGFAAALLVVTLCGRRFFAGAWREIRRGRSNMDTLVALGSSTAFGYSTWGLLAGIHGHLYFAEASAIITLISAGHWLESLASVRASRSLRSLMTLAPDRARRLADDGTEEDIAVESLRIGERIVLKPGDRVPVDAEVLEGSAAVDESMLTGESLPVEKAAGAKLYAGTVDHDGRLVARVSATGETTALAQIVAVVQRAQASRAGIQRLADRVSSVFVPIVAVIALAAALWWGLGFESARAAHETLASILWTMALPSTALAAAFVHASAVLIVACPCAMGLATPAAIMVGTNVAARRGILIRDGVALEKSGTITSVVFDKTGTLTRGALTVADARSLGAADAGPDPILRLAAALAQPSNHPLSRAVARLGAGAMPPETDPPTGAPGLDLEGWQEVRGRGVEAAWNGAPARLGALDWLRGLGVDLAGADGFVDEWTTAGATVVGLSVGTRLRGLIALRDELKPEADRVVRDLSARGLRTYLITGDAGGTARALADRVGIDPANVFAEVRPEEKARLIGELQARGERVAFVGDGINDAPGLEQADLGIAVSRASDVAREAADVILLKSEIHAIPEALGLARATLRTIRQNLFWAFFYNAAAVPLAAMGFLNPILCAATMGLSDLIVIGNALRLERWRRWPAPDRAEPSR